MDDHDAIDGLGDLGEDVAGDEDRASLGRERAQEVPEPSDPGRIEAVRRLIEHEHFRVAEQRRREAEALAHPERVALHALFGGGAQLNEREHLLHPRRAQAGRGGLHPQMVLPERPGCTSLASSTAPTRCSGRSSRL